MILQKHLSLAMTLRCNLKCILCSAASPYYKNPTVYSADIIKHSIDSYFEFVEQVQKFTFTGGEPLLNKALSEVVAYFARYSNQTVEPEIITNGTILPNNELIYALKQIPHIRILVDNYGIDISKKVPEITDLLATNNIRFSIRKYYGQNAHCGGWVDFRDLSLRKRNSKQTFAKCAYPHKMGFCFTMIGGKIFPCSVTRRCIEQKIVPFDKSLCLDIFDKNISLQQKEQWFKTFENITALSTCSFCDGLSDDAERFCPGIQGDNLEKYEFVW